ncbi:MAG TPA: carboxypeptidase regulatory-like domain-containing protein, partial [Acidobacteria bacterium]|nr:carboxypeptidase regulatory-like domain-containing protein [Acidobacteriota bacterium]
MGGRVTSKLIGAVVVLVMASCAPPDESMTGLQIDADDIGGIVTSAVGSEAGVWVIAETMDLPTRFIRIVSTDDDGQYVLPDLPEATY